MDGPFVPLSGTPVTSTDVMFCAVDLSSTTTAHTYELHFTNCNSSNVCTLELDEDPAYPCTQSCNPKVVWTTNDASDSGTPFDYYEAASGWTTPVPPAQVVPSEIQAIQVTLTLASQAYGGSRFESVQRMILLPNTLPSGGS